MIQFIKQVLSEGTEGASSKRVISVVGSMVIFALTGFFQTEILIDATVIIICAALGVTGATAIFKKDKNNG